jgi:hypothetical protein
MRAPWLGTLAAIPSGFETARLRVRPLTIHDTVKDYDAVMSSRAELRGMFGPGSDWPAESLSIEDDLIDLAWHQKEFRIRRSFAYTVVAPDEARVLGCVYIYPPSHAGCDADVYYWVRSSELGTGLEAHLWEQLRGWLAAQWPFGMIALPQRDPDRHDLRAGSL